MSYSIALNATRHFCQKTNIIMPAKIALKRIAIATLNIEVDPHIAKDTTIVTDTLVIDHIAEDALTVVTARHMIDDEAPPIAGPPFTKGTNLQLPLRHGQALTHRLSSQRALSYHLCCQDASS